MKWTKLSGIDGVVEIRLIKSMQMYFHRALNELWFDYKQ